MSRSVLVAAITALGLSAFSLPALAQTAPPPSARQACRSSAISLCSTEINAHDIQAVKLCLWKNLDKVTPECRDAINAQRAAHAASPPPAPN